MLWLYEIPLAVLGLVVFLPLLAYTLGGLVLVRRWVHALQETENDVAATLLSTAAVAYAVLLAMIAVAAWNGQTVVETAVQEEANALASIYRQVEAYDPADRDHFRLLVADYVDFVVRDEWPAMQKARRSPRTELASRALAGELAAYRPAGAHAAGIHPLILDQATRFTDARRMRILVGNHGLSALTWAVVILGAMITIAPCWFLRARSVVFHGVLCAFVAMTMALLIFLIVAMDHPLWGEASVSPDAFQEVLLQLVGTHGGPHAVPSTVPAP